MEKSMKMQDSGAINRTGMSTSPHAEQMNQVPELTRPTHGDGEMQVMHASYLADAHPLGTVPPPNTAKGMAKTAVQALKGGKAIVLVDKIAERLAFERTGVRLYDALLGKVESGGSYDGGPSRDELQTIRDEEHAHARMLAESLESLGADPTAVTPSADLVAIEGAGLGSVLADARTSVGQSLHALLVAELADNEGWLMLRRLAEDMGQNEMAERFGAAEQDEQRHLNAVRSWVQAHVSAEASLL